MAVIQHAASSPFTSSVVGSEITLADIAVPGTFTLHIDMSNMASGDLIELRVYQILLTGGTRKVAYVQSFNHAQPTDNLIAISVPISNDLTDAGSLRFSLFQRNGTARAFIWKVLRYI